MRMTSPPHSSCCGAKSSEPSESSCAKAADEFRCIGFSSFADNYKDRFSRWFDTLVAGKTNPHRGGGTDRLGELQRVLARLACQLDVVVNWLSSMEAERITEPRWARPCRPPERTRHTSPNSFAGFEQG